MTRYTTLTLAELMDAATDNCGGAMYTVIYRTGGRERCEWLRVYEQFRSWEDALVCAREIERMGYKTLIERTDRLNSIGMPKGWGCD